MFNIKKQINRLYSSAVFGQISLSGAWVAILASRGFSLAQIGFAETVFHIVSILFEIPSGVLADVLGRKKTLVISCLMRIIGDIVMVLSNNFAMVCLSIAFHALNYNFSSGSGDALAFDSLKSVGQEDRFDRYASNQLVIYRVCEGLSTLTAGFALVIGYRLAYATGIAMALVQLAILAGLVEIRLSPLPQNFNVWKEIANCFKQSFLFLKEAKKAML
ncbi:MAG: MFS transporter, partial [Treponema sp.]|nr:MFS transporter [Treponema sp.]